MLLHSTFENLNSKPENRFWQAFSNGPYTRTRYRLSLDWI